MDGEHEEDWLPSESNCNELVHKQDSTAAECHGGSDALAHILRSCATSYDGWHLGDMSAPCSKGTGE